MSQNVCRRSNRGENLNRGQGQNAYVRGVQTGEGHIEEHELARKMWSRYLHDEWKYDKFGAQGKFILLQEIFSEEGLSPQPGTNYQKIINRVFPRTFYCEHLREISAPLANTVLRYVRRLDEQFTNQGLPRHVVEHICLSETAEKFCLQAASVQEITRGFAGPS